MDINDCIDQAIEALADDNINLGAEALEQLARQWSKAGLPQSTFADIRIYIIKEASERTDALFIAEKLTIIERELRNDRRIVVH